MENSRRAASRWLEVSPERIETWLDSFGRRHGGEAVRLQAGPEVVIARAADGCAAECHVPFPPLPEGRGGTAAGLAAHASQERTVAVLLVRLGGYAAGVFAGPEPRLIASKVGSRLVHGRSAAGGQSQQRFARRREKQAREALAAAADTAVAVFGPVRDRIEVLVLGGDKRSVAALAGDPRLAPYLALATDRFLTVPDPRQAVLAGTPRLFRAIRIRLTDCGAG